MNNITNLPTSIQKIILDISSYKDKMTPQQARNIVMNASVRAEDIEYWQDYHHPLTNSYGRKSLFTNSLFEIMVMSWCPGDISTIHDHGHAQWGAVQVFGYAEHATFLVQDNRIVTTSRHTIKPGEVIPVAHQLIHQMGNQTEQNFLTLHIYGLCASKFDISITGDARIFNITEGIIQKTNGGVFFALPDSQINAIYPSPQPDYISWLRNTTEYIKRVRKINKEIQQDYLKNLERKLINDIFDINSWQVFKTELMANIDSDGFVTNFNYWNLLWNELLQASQLQCELIGEIHNKDSCYSYAEIYDEVVRKESLKKITSKYIQFIHCKYHLDLSSSRILSIGCGTGIMEEYLLKNYYLEWDNVLGIDTSESMIKLASKRINAFVGDILDIKYTNSCDIAFASLNVFQSFVPSLMEEAIEKTSRIIKNDGYLIADFITSDHIRRYRNILDSENVVLLRKPSLIEESHNIIQQNEVINVAILNSKLQIMYGGKHNYYLPSICQVRYILGKFFNRVDIFDALTFAYLNPEDDTSPSTQYLIVAQK